jgi:hypothetical protein
MPKKYGTPGPRLIMPTVCTSVPLAGCCVEAQLLFDRLIAQADDQGRLQGEPRVVAALCMPLVRAATERAVGRWLAELAETGLVARYEVGAVRLIQLRGWWDNQGSPRRAYPSRYPAPDGWADRVRIDGEPPRIADDAPPDRGQPADIPPASSPQFAGELAADRGQDDGARARGTVPTRPVPTRPVLNGEQQPQAVSAQEGAEDGSWFDAKQGAAVDLAGKRP